MLVLHPTKLQNFQKMLSVRIFGLFSSCVCVPWSFFSLFFTQTGTDLVSKVVISLSFNAYSTYCLKLSVIGMMRFVCAGCACSVVTAVLGTVPLCTCSSCTCWHYLWTGGWGSGQSKSCVHIEGTGNVYLWTQGNILVRRLKTARKQRQLCFVLVLYNKLSSEEKIGKWAWYSGTTHCITASTVQC